MKKVGGGMDRLLTMTTRWLYRVREVEWRASVGYFIIIALASSPLFFILVIINELA